VDGGGDDGGEDMDCIGEGGGDGSSGKDASAEDDDVGRARRSSSEYCSSAFFIIHMMSWNCRSKSGVILAWSLG